MQHIIPDTYILVIDDVISKDEGLYSVVARNPAGAVSASAMIHVEDNEDEFAYRTYHRGRNVKAKQVDNNRIFGDYYDLGDELGRGTQGVTYHSVERSTGRSLAAKIMTGTGPELRSRMTGELDIMNQLSHQRLVRLIDAYETKDSLTLVSELAGGGDLVDAVTRRPHITESDIAYYIRQVLEGLGHMHSHGIAHLGLTPGDLFLTRPDGDELKIGDFGLARRIYSNKLASLDYGMPEFVAPETANGEGVGFPADMWSVGVITYLFLSGISPFRGETDRDTLRRVQAGQINFDPEAFSNISSEATDFVTKLLVFKADGRLTLEEVRFTLNFTKFVHLRMNWS
jgi:serine/threonine protein kinase